MKYFTPDLLERYGSLDDRVADAAHDEWEQTCTRYQERLASLKRYLPGRFNAFLDEYALHDAGVIRGYGGDAFASRIGDKPQYFIELLVGPPPGERVVLMYQVCGSRPHDKSGGCFWLYDEVGAVDLNAPPVFSHTILFSDGVELEVHFTGFDFVKKSSLCNNP